MFQHNLFLLYCPLLQASCHTTSSASRQASCYPRCHRWMTCSPGSGSCSCWPSPAWLCCLVPSSAASVRSDSNLASSHRMDSIRRSSDPSWDWVCLLTYWCLLPSRANETHTHTHTRVKCFTVAEPPGQITVGVFEENYIVPDISVPHVGTAVNVYRCRNVQWWHEGAGGILRKFCSCTHVQKASVQSACCGVLNSHFYLHEHQKEMV